MTGWLDPNTSQDLLYKVDLEGINALIIDLENVEYVFSFGLRTLLIFQKMMEKVGGTEQQPTDLLRKMIATTGRKLSEEEKSLVKEKLTPYFDEKLLNTVIDKFASSGEYNIDAVEVGCAMAITHQISNSLGGKRTNDFDKGKNTYYRR